MPRPVECKIHREGKNRSVCVYFSQARAGYTSPEHFMDIEVTVKDGGVMLKSGQYDAQIYFPLSVLPSLVATIQEAADDA